MMALCPRCGYQSADYDTELDEWFCTREFCGWAEFEDE